MRHGIRVKVKLFWETKKVSYSPSFCRPHPLLGCRLCSVQIRFWKQMFIFLDLPALGPFFFGGTLNANCIFEQHSEVPKSLGETVCSENISERTLGEGTGIFGVMSSRTCSNWETWSASAPGSWDKSSSSTSCRLFSNIGCIWKSMRGERAIILRTYTHSVVQGCQTLWSYVAYDSESTKKFHRFIMNKWMDY